MPDIKRKTTKAKAPAKKKAKDKSEKVRIGDKSITVRATRKDSKINLAQAIKLRVSGMSLEEIGKTQGVARQNIHKALEPYREHIEQLHVYRGNRDSLQDMASSKLLNTLMTKDMESEKASSLAAAFKVFNDASRLERGESTQNISLKVVDLTGYLGDNET